MPKTFANAFDGGGTAQASFVFKARRMDLSRLSKAKQSKAKRGLRRWWRQNPDAVKQALRTQQSGP